MELRRRTPWTRASRSASPSPVLSRNIGFRLSIRVPAMVTATLALYPAPPPSSRPQFRVRWRSTASLGSGFPRRNFGGNGGSLVRFRSGSWSGACRAQVPNSDDIVTSPLAFVADQPQVFYFAVANAQSLMLEGPPLESVLQHGIERAERAKRARDVWLILEPAFLSEHPGLKTLNAQLTKPTAAILSTNADWMLSYVKKSLPMAVMGKFTSPSEAVPDPLKSNISGNNSVVSGGGVWH